MGFTRVQRPESLPRHLSVSSVQQYERCPYAWQQRYLKRRKVDMPAPVLFGGVMAHALEALHLGRDAEVAFVKRHAAEAERLRAKGEMLTPDAEYGLGLLRLYRDLPAYQGQPEWPFSIKLPVEFRCPVPIVGFADLKTAGGIVEFKTSRARWTQERADSEYQAAMYAEAFRRDTGREPNEVRYVVMNTMWSGIKEIVTHPGREHFERFARAAGAVWRHISARDFDRRCGNCEFCRADLPEAEVAA